jgi:hypothetical protein
VIEKDKDPMSKLRFTYLILHIGAFFSVTKKTVYIDISIRNKHQKQ